jgi:NAD(P)-dependent dehydrogenase (short-subunit alcohol dehydrogenase family)
MTEHSFAGKVVVVTGAGAAVVVAARRQELLDETAALVRQAGGDAHVVTADLRSEKACSALVTETLERLGRLDVLVNNAAVPGQDQSVSDMSLENWNDTIATNLTAPMLLSREALNQAMVPARRGNIQFFSSAAAKSVLPRKAHYAVAKLGLLPLAQTLAMEVGRDGIRVNTLVIGTTQGDLVESYIRRIAAEEQVEPERVVARLTASSALGRLVTPDEVADVSMWLASDAARAITGQDINVTAGAEKR